MTVTYSTALTLDRDKIRLRIGDTVSGKGPRPQVGTNSNFDDAEITFVLTEESTVNASIAHFFEILANEWSSYALSEREGETNFDAKEVAENYRKQAAIWRAKPGGASEAERSGNLITLTRTDAWTTSESEYS